MISTDPIEVNTKFAKEHEADFPILSDVAKEVGTKYGVLGMTGMAKRWTFYIDPDGKILHIDTGVKPASSGADMVARLAELKIAKRK